MNLRLSLGALLFSLCLAAGGAEPAAPAASTPATPPPAALRELTVVVVETIGPRATPNDDFDRIDVVFTQVIKQLKWPVTVKFERFAANLKDHDPELRIFFKGMYEEGFGDLTFHAWVTCTIDGKKHDFGMMRPRYDLRPGEPMEDALQSAVRKAALQITAKIEPLLFPKPAAPKP